MIRTLSPAICGKRERLTISHRGIVEAFCSNLEYVDAQWSTRATVDITDIPAGTTLQALTLEIMRAGGVEIFKASQRMTFALLCLKARNETNPALLALKRACSKGEPITEVLA